MKWNYSNSHHVVGQTLWNWICSAAKRPYLNYSFEQLLEETKRLKANQTNEAESIRSELSYRKRLKEEKKKLILKTLLEKGAQDQIHPTPSAHKTQSKEPEDEEELARSREETEKEELGEETKAEDGQDASFSREESETEELGEATKAEDGQDASFSREETETEELGEETKAEDGQDASFSREESETEELGEEATAENRQDASFSREETKTEELGEEPEPKDEQADQAFKATQTFSMRTQNALNRNGITDFSELKTMSDDKILSLKGVGQQTLDEIRRLFPLEKHELQNESSEAASISKRSKPKDPLQEAGDLESEQFIDLNNLYPFASYPKAAEYFSNKLRPRQIHALLTEVGKPRLEYFLRRCEGETLQSIGDDACLTRERVRQHCAKIEKKTGLIIKDIAKQINLSQSQESEIKIAQAFEKDLSQTGTIGVNVSNAWQAVYQRTPTLADRINIFKKYNTPISLAELNSHIDSIESGTGSYGGESYWKKSTIRSLIWCMSIRLGKTGIMPKQVEMPRLLSRYIQKDFGGQRRASEIFGLEYIGPIGSRNRSYWTEDRIADAILNTQKYFCIPTELMPEQSHLNYYLDIDNDDDTKGPSCVAAIKRFGSWEDGAKQLGLQVFAELTPEQKTAMEKQIAINFWNKNIPFSSKSVFLDSANMFMNTFWRAPAEPNRYNGIMTQMRSISRLISDKKIQLNETLTMQSLLPASPLNNGEHDSSNNQAIDEIMDILF